MPDDWSGTYIVNVLTNTTQVLAPPVSKDTAAFYFADITSIVEIDSTGSVFYLPYTQGDAAANAAAAWSPVKALSAIASSVPTQRPSGSSGTPTSTKTTVSGTSKPTSGATQQNRISSCMLVAVWLVLASRLL
jgi:hypothetical protein